MGWQEELRRIDADLAAGKLTKEQYALRREELLAEASSAPSTAHAEPPPAQAAAAVSATKLAPEPEPEPETRIEPGKPPVPAQQLLRTDRPTTAPSPADHEPTDSIPHPKTLPPQTDQSPPAQAPDLPSVAHDRSAAAKPSLAPAPPLPAYQQAPTKSRKSGKSMAIAVAVVLLMAIGGFLWLTSKDSDKPANAAPPPPGSLEVEPGPPAGLAQPDASKPSGLVDKLPQLPGVLNRNSGSHTPAEGAKLELYGADEAQLLEQHGVRKVTWKGSSRNAGKSSLAYVVLAAENASKAKAEATARAMRQLSVQRVSKVGGLTGHEDLPTYRKLTKESSVYRVIYTSGNKTVRLGVLSTPGGDQQRLAKEMSLLLDEITKVLPPNS